MRPSHYLSVNPTHMKQLQYDVEIRNDYFTWKPKRIVKNWNHNMNLKVRKFYTVSPSCVQWRIANYYL